MNHQHIPSAPRMDAVMDSCGDYEKPHRFVQRVFAAGKAIEIENAALTARITELEERNGALEEKCTLFAASLNKADDRIAELGAALTDMEQRKDGAYLERNQVVAALAKAHSSGKARTAIEGWSEDWHGCVYIDLPTGQVSWHYHDSHAHLFNSIPHYLGAWDGHSTEEKYERIASLARTAVPSEGQAIPTWQERVPGLATGDVRAMQIHDAKDAEIADLRAALANTRAAAPAAEGASEIEVCNNCDTAAPGCGGLFRKDGASCKFHGSTKEGAGDADQA